MTINKKGKFNPDYDSFDTSGYLDSALSKIGTNLTSDIEDSKIITNEDILNLYNYVNNKVELANVALTYHLEEGSDTYHGITKENALFDKIDNYPIATKEEVKGLTLNNVYVTTEHLNEILNEIMVDKVNTLEMASRAIISNTDTLNQGIYNISYYDVGGIGVTQTITERSDYDVISPVYEFDTHINIVNINDDKTIIVPTIKGDIDLGIPFVRSYIVNMTDSYFKLTPSGFCYNSSFNKNSSTQTFLLSSNGSYKYQTFDGVFGSNFKVTDNGSTTLPFLNLPTIIDFEQQVLVQAGYEVTDNEIYFTFNLLKPKHDDNTIIASNLTNDIKGSLNLKDLNTTINQRTKVKVDIKNLINFTSTTNVVKSIELISNNFYSKNKLNSNSNCLITYLKITYGNEGSTTYTHVGTIITHCSYVDGVYKFNLLMTPTFTPQTQPMNLKAISVNTCIGFSTSLYLTTPYDKDKYVFHNPYFVISNFVQNTSTNLLTNYNGTGFNTVGYSFNVENGKIVVNKYKYSNLTSSGGCASLGIYNVAYNSYNVTVTKNITAITPNTNTVIGNTIQRALPFRDFTTPEYGYKYLTFGVDDNGFNVYKIYSFNKVLEIAKIADNQAVISTDNSTDSNILNLDGHQTRVIPNSLIVETGNGGNNPLTHGLAFTKSNGFAGYLGVVLDADGSVELDTPMRVDPYFMNKLNNYKEEFLTKAISYYETFNVVIPSDLFDSYEFQIYNLNNVLNKGIILVSDGYGYTEVALFNTKLDGNIFRSKTDFSKLEWCSFPAKNIKMNHDFTSIIKNTERGFTDLYLHDNRTDYSMNYSEWFLVFTNVYGHKGGGLTIPIEYLESNPIIKMNSYQLDVYNTDNDNYPIYIKGIGLHYWNWNSSNKMGLVYTRNTLRYNSNLMDNLNNLGFTNVNYELSMDRTDVKASTGLKIPGGIEVTLNGVDYVLEDGVIMTHKGNGYIYLELKNGMLTPVYYETRPTDFNGRIRYCDINTVNGKISITYYLGVLTLDNKEMSIERHPNTFPYYHKGVSKYWYQDTDIVTVSPPVVIEDKYPASIGIKVFESTSDYTDYLYQNEYNTNMVIVDVKITKPSNLNTNDNYFGDIELVYDKDKFTVTENNTTDTTGYTLKRYLVLSDNYENSELLFKTLNNLECGYKVGSIYSPKSIKALSSSLEVGFIQNKDTPNKELKVNVEYSSSVNKTILDSKSDIKANDSTRLPLLSKLEGIEFKLLETNWNNYILECEYEIIVKENVHSEQTLLIEDQMDLGLSDKVDITQLITIESIEIEDKVLDYLDKDNKSVLIEYKVTPTNYEETFTISVDSNEEDDSDNSDDDGIYVEYDKDSNEPHLINDLIPVKDNTVEPIVVNLKATSELGGCNTKAVYSYTNPTVYIGTGIVSDSVYQLFSPIFEYLDYISDIKMYDGDNNKLDFTLDNGTKMITFTNYEKGDLKFNFKIADDLIDMSNMFSNCNNLTSLDMSNFDTSNVTNMSYMFYDCKNLTSIGTNTLAVQLDCNTNDIFGKCDKLDPLPSIIILIY